MENAAESLRNFYIWESRRLSKQLDEILESWRETGFISSGDINEIFRIVHTVKGEAPMMGHISLGRLAHKTEELLSNTREGKSLRDDEKDAAYGLLRRSAGLLASELIKIGTIQSPCTDIDSFSEEINTYTDKIKPFIPMNTNTKIPKNPSSKAFPHKARVFFKSDPGSEAARAFLLVTSLKKVCKNFEYFPAIENNPGASGEIAASGLTLMFREAHDLEKAIKSIESTPGVKSLRQLAFPESALPLKVLLGDMESIVRDMGPKLGKKARLKVSCEDLLIDKAPAASLMRSAVHIVRNAMDHGIETQDQRLSKGKPPEGLILVSVRSTQSGTTITIRDDGAGIDAEKLAAAAKSKGLPAEAYTAEDITALVTLPGFTTKETASKFSGRGIGMDAVKNEMESLGGTVKVWSAPGDGVRVVLKLPFPLKQSPEKPKAI